MTRAEWFGVVLCSLVECGADRGLCERVGEILDEWPDSDFEKGDGE